MYFISSLQIISQNSWKKAHSTHHADRLQLSQLGADKGNKQLMIQSIQAPGSIFSPKRRKGRG